MGDGSIDGDNRNAVAAMGGQHEIAAGEAGCGRAVAHINGQVDGRFQHFADRRRQALAEGNLIALAVFEPVDADLLAFALD